MSVKALRRSRYDRAHAIYRETRRLQLKAARNRGILPSTYYITSKDLSREIDPFAGGGFADVYKGKLNGEPVVLKKVKWYLNQGSMEKVRKVSNKFIDKNVSLIIYARKCAKKHLSGGTWIMKT